MRHAVRLRTTLNGPLPTVYGCSLYPWYRLDVVNVVHLFVTVHLAGIQNSLAGLTTHRSAPITMWRNSHFRTKKTQAAVQRLLWLRTGPMSPCAQSKWLRNSRYMSMTDSDGYLAISRNHTLTRPAQLFFFGVCAPGRFSWLQSLGRTQVAPRGGADGAGTPARTATSTSTCQTCLWDGL